MKKILMHLSLTTCLFSGGVYAAPPEAALLQKSQKVSQQLDASSVVVESSFKVPSEKSDEVSYFFDFRVETNFRETKNCSTPFPQRIDTMTPVSTAKLVFDDFLVPGSETDVTFFSMLSLSPHSLMSSPPSSDISTTE